MEHEKDGRSKSYRFSSKKKWFRDLLTILKKDLLSTKRVKKYFFAAVIPPLILLVVFSSVLESDNPETYNVMLVDDDKSHYSELMTECIENISSEFAPWFTVYIMDSYESAQIKLLNYEIMGLIYIPEGFQKNITSRNFRIKGTLILEVQNVNNDYVKNYIQRMDEAVLEFNQKTSVAHRNGNKAELVAKKTYVIDQQISNLKGFAIGILGIYGVVCGLLYGSLNVTKEYEDLTIIEIAMSPVKRTAYIASKQIIAIILGLIVVGVIGSIIFISFNIEFRGNLLIVACAFIISTWLHACIGGLIGLKIKNIMSVTLISIVSSILMFFFMGGFAPIKILGPNMYIASRFFPGTYWMEILFAETFLPSLEYSLLRLAILTMIAIPLTILMWYFISREGFRE